MGDVLVINSGSSSFKYQLLDPADDHVYASGLVERIGEPSGRVKHVVGSGDEASEFVTELPIPDHTAGFTAMLEAFNEHGPDLAEHAPSAVGHRVVHGGSQFVQPTVITPEVTQRISDLSELAPLHNPGAVQGIRAAEQAFPDVPHVAVFDTAFFQTLAPAAYTYAIDREVAAQNKVRRYGFHGTSHEYVSRAAAAYLGRPYDELKQIVFHLGNGASVSAVDRGLAVDTSMGLTPLEGLVMGTRSGDIDPGVLFHLVRTAGYKVDDLDELLNKRSGLVGLSGVGDMRDMLAKADAGDDAAQLAYDVYIHRLRAYAGAYLAQLDGADVISFTAGVGENNARIRAGACETLGFAGVDIDPVRNEARGSGIREISRDSSHVKVLVVPTNEELAIARHTLEVLDRA